MFAVASLMLRACWRGRYLAAIAACRWPGLLGCSGLGFGADQSGDGRMAAQLFCKQRRRVGSMPPTGMPSLALIWRRQRGSSISRASRYWGQAGEGLAQQVAADGFGVGAAVDPTRGAPAAEGAGGLGPGRVGDVEPGAVGDPGLSAMVGGSAAAWSSRCARAPAKSSRLARSRALSSSMNGSMRMTRCTGMATSCSSSAPPTGMWVQPLSATSSTLFWSASSRRVTRPGSAGIALSRARARLAGSSAQRRNSNGQRRLTGEKGLVLGQHRD